MGVSASQIRKEFIAEMGGDPDSPQEPVNAFVSVELSDAAYKTIVQSAKRWFTAKRGFNVFRPVPYVDGQSQYKMKDDVAQVLDVIFQVPSDVAAFYTLGFFDIIPYGPNTLTAVGSGLTSYSGFAQLLEFTENRKKVFSVDPDYYYDQQNRILNVTVRQGAANSFMMVYAKLSEYEIDKLSDKDSYLMARYIKSLCKEAVGRVRSKYDSLPGAAGPVTLDGQRLIDEAKEEKLALDEEIFAASGPDMPYVF